MPGHIKSQEPVTAIFTQTVKAGKEAEYDRFLHELIQAVHKFDGHEEVRVIKEDNRRYHIIHRFADGAKLNAWLTSPVRQSLIGRLRELIEDDEIRPRKLTGFEAWFQAPVGSTGHAPRWKMLVVTFLGAYPVVVLFQWLIAPHIQKWHLLLRALAFPVVILTMMTYLIMPNLTKWLSGWLYNSA